MAIRYEFFRWKLGGQIGGFNFIKKRLNNFEVEKLEKGIYIGSI